MLYKCINCVNDDVIVLHSAVNPTNWNNSYVMPVTRSAVIYDRGADKRTTYCYFDVLCIYDGVKFQLKGFHVTSLQDYPCGITKNILDTST